MRVLAGAIALILSTLSAGLYAEDFSSAAQSHCLNFAKRLGSVYESDCLGQRFEFTDYFSVKANPILLKEFPSARTNAPRVLVVGGIHGDELSSVSIVFGWIRYLRNLNEQEFHWRLTPSMNPDGLYQRPSSRTNANGVDLNRNFPTPNWEVESEKYWVGRTRKNPRRYPGPQALSEPESRWLHEEILKFQPDAIIAVHAPFGIVDFDGPSNPPKKLGQLHLNLLGTYPGSLGNYAGVQRGIPVVTVELPSAGSMPSRQQQQRIWNDLNNWLRKNLDSHPTPAQPLEAAQLQP